MPNFSATARVAGTTEQPGCDCENSLESSVSSECASMPLMNAASGGLAVIFEATIVDVLSVLKSRAYANAARAGGRSDPEIMAANVSRIWCLAFSTTSSGRARPAASLIYALSLAITGLTLSAANTPLGIAAAAMLHPARCSRLRRLKLPPLLAGRLLEFRWCRMVFLPRNPNMFAAARESNTALSLTSHLPLANSHMKEFPSRACVVLDFVYNWGGSSVRVGYVIRVLH